MSNPSPSHSLKRRGDGRWRWGPESIIHTQSEARDGWRSGTRTRQGRLEWQWQVTVGARESDPRSAEESVRGNDQRRRGADRPSQPGRCLQCLESGSRPPPIRKRRLEPTRSPAHGPGLASGRRTRSRAGPCQWVTVARRLGLCLASGATAHPLAPDSAMIDGGLASGRPSHCQSGPCLGQP